MEGSSSFGPRRKARRHAPGGLAGLLLPMPFLSMELTDEAYRAAVGSATSSVVLGGAFTILWLVSAVLFGKAADSAHVRAGRHGCQEPS